MPVDLEKSLLKLRVEAIREFPLCITKIAMTVPVQVDKSFPGLLRLRKFKIIFSQELLDEYTFKDILFVFLHGILAILFKHEERSKSHVWTKADQYLWSVASEVCRTCFMERYLPSFFSRRIGEGQNVVRQFLSKEDFNPHLPPDKHIKNTMSVENIYYILKELMESGAEQIEKEAASTLSLGLQPDESDELELGEYKKGEFEEFEEDIGGSVIESDIQETTRKAISTLSRGLDSLHGELQYFAFQYFPELNKNISRIRRMLLSLAGEGKGKFFSSQRPRRRLPKQAENIKLLQLARRGYGRVAVIADVSGSTSGHRETLFNNLVSAVKACDRIDIYIGDTTILEKKLRVTQIDQLKSLPDGFGTDMRAIMEEIDKKGYNSIVVISDGETPWPDKELRAKTYYFPFGNFTLRGVPKWIRII